MPKMKAGASGPPTPRPQRLEELEDILRTKGWTTRLEHELATTWNVGRETVRRDLQIIRAALRERLGSVDLETRRGTMVARLDALADQARTAGKVGPAIHALKLSASMQGLDVPPPREDTPDDEPEPADALEALQARLRDTRRLRRAAERSDTHTAVVTYLRLEADLLAAITVETRARADATKVAATDDEMVAALVEGLKALPDSLRLRVLKGV